jgi:phosphoribosylaminoimidazole-succinocarboxamide synthase
MRLDVCLEIHCADADGFSFSFCRGKVRELYKINDSTLLMAVSDRISAYDVVLSTGIPDKGAVLCQISGS